LKYNGWQTIHVLRRRSRHLLLALCERVQGSRFTGAQRMTM